MGSRFRSLPCLVCWSGYPLSRDPCRSMSWRQSTLLCGTWLAKMVGAQSSSVDLRRRIYFQQRKRMEYSCVWSRYWPRRTFCSDARVGKIWSRCFTCIHKDVHGDFAVGIVETLEIPSSVASFLSLGVCFLFALSGRSLFIFLVFLVTAYLLTQSAGVSFAAVNICYLNLTVLLWESISSFGHAFQCLHCFFIKRLFSFSKCPLSFQVQALLYRFLLQITLIGMLMRENERHITTFSLCMESDDELPQLSG